MSKQLKRVPLDFQGKVGVLWEGYKNPHLAKDCPSCGGYGYSEEYLALKEKWFSFDNQIWQKNPFRKNARYNINSWSHNITQEDVEALLAADRLWDFTRVPLNEEQVEIVRKKIEAGENSWLPFNNGYIPTAKEVNEWNLKGLGHDSINMSVIIKARLKSSGLPHICNGCAGEGTYFSSKEVEALHKAWQPQEPPTGEGFQLWNDESPITPVFENLDLLCEYCEAQEVSVFGKQTATKERWKEMLENGFVHVRADNVIFC